MSHIWTTPTLTSLPSFLTTLMPPPLLVRITLGHLTTLLPLPLCSPNTLTTYLPLPLCSPHTLTKLYCHPLSNLPAIFNPPPLSTWPCLHSPFLNLPTPLYLPPPQFIYSHHHSCPNKHFASYFYMDRLSDCFKRWMWGTTCTYLNCNI